MLKSFGIEHIPAPENGSSLTIGMFDGVHLGHQKVLRETVRQAEHTNTTPVAITFDVHPRKLLDPAGAPPMITSLQHRLNLFEQLGIKQAVVLPFTRELAGVEAEQFAREFFFTLLGAKAITLGFNATFGKMGLGNINLLEKIKGTRPLQLQRIPQVMINGETVSSTNIRKAVLDNRIEDASMMLGRPVSVLGTVVPGLGLGRTLGFPTLNLDPHHELKPRTGVYFTRTRWGCSHWDSVTNIGHRPTIDAKVPEDVLVETHLLDYKGDLYGQEVEVMFLKKHRDEKKFANREELTAQISNDVKEARAYFCVTR